MTTFLKLQADKQALKRKTPSSERTSTAENNSSASPSSDSLSDSIEDESGIRKLWKNQRRKRRVCLSIFYLINLQCICCGANDFLVNIFQTRGSWLTFRHSHQCFSLFKILVIVSHNSQKLKKFLLTGAVCSLVPGLSNTS